MVEKRYRSQAREEREAIGTARKKFPPRDTIAARRALQTTLIRVLESQDIDLKTQIH